MSTTFDETKLKSTLERLAKSHAWSPGLLKRLEDLFHEKDDFALYRINPLERAGAWKAGEDEVLDLFLAAAHEGLFSMDWDVLCPGCGDLAERFDTLSYMHSSFSCGICEKQYEADLDGTIEITFTASAQVRRIRALDPASLTPEEFHYRYLLNASGLMSKDLPYSQGIRPYVRVSDYLEPGQNRSWSFDVAEAVLTGFDGLNKCGFWFPVAGEPVKERQKISSVLGAKKYEPSFMELRPGPVEFRAENRSSKRSALFLYNTPAGISVHPNQYRPFLSAKRLFTCQTFRELFRKEILASGESFKAKTLCLLFTDLKGSTALYEKIGDVKAFALVSQHFDILTSKVRAHRGALVKTIGDAVMAAFSDSADAVAAARAMAAAIAEFNRARGGEEILLKLGMHCGPAISVNLNGVVDFFGQTVNTAARVQNLAEAGELCLTGEVLAAEGVRKGLHGLDLIAEDAVLRGVQAPVPVHRIKLL